MCVCVWIYPRKSSVCFYVCWCVWKIVAPLWFWTCTGLYSLGWNTAPGRSTRSMRIDRVTIDRESREQSSIWPVDGDRPGLPCYRPGWIDRQTREQKCQNPCWAGRLSFTSIDRVVDRAHRPGLQKLHFWPRLQSSALRCYSNFSKTFAAAGRRNFLKHNDTPNTR